MQVDFGTDYFRKEGGRILNLLNVNPYAYDFEQELSRHAGPSGLISIHCPFMKEEARRFERFKNAIEKSSKSWRKLLNR